jgi:hypothetical protein
LRGKNIAVGLSFFTSAGVLAYWSLVFAGIFPVEEIIPGYRDWFLAFPLADLWIAVCAFLAGIFLVNGRELAAPFGIAAGSGLIFLGLYALLYGINTGLLFNLNVGEIIEIGIKLYSLSVGSFFIVCFWRVRNSLAMRHSST